MQSDLPPRDQLFDVQQTVFATTPTPDLHNTPQIPRGQQQNHMIVINHLADQEGPICHHP